MREYANEAPLELFPDDSAGAVCADAGGGEVVEAHGGGGEATSGDIGGDMNAAEDVVGGGAVADDEAEAGRAEVLAYLSSVLRGEGYPELAADGREERPGKQPDIKDRLKAAELLGKRYRLFADNLSLEGAARVVIVDDLAASGKAAEGR